LRLKNALGKFQPDPKNSAFNAPVLLLSSSVFDVE
jgi:hypothetical protein